MTTTPQPPTVSFKGKQFTPSAPTPKSIEAAWRRIRQLNPPDETPSETAVELVGLISILGEDTAEQLLNKSDADLAAGLNEYRRSLCLDDYDAMTAFVMSPILG